MALVCPGGLALVWLWEPAWIPQACGRQQPCLVLGCVELCWEEGGYVRESCLGVCVREKDTLVCLDVRMCLCVHARTADLLQCEYVYMCQEGRGVMSVQRLNKINAIVIYFEIYSSDGD